MNILGINAYHGDSSAAIICDGQLVAAVEEERFNRVKHWAGFPAQSILFCLQQAGVTPSDLDHVATSFDPWANMGRKVLHTIRRPGGFAHILNRLQRQRKSHTIKDCLAESLGVSPSAIGAKFHKVQHHDAHLACGFFLSQFEDAAILSIDGMGDFVSTVTAVGKGTEFTKLDEVFFPHSLGYLYNAVTMYLGFPRYGDEYKVMGLAPYGQPTYLEVFRDMIRPKGDTFELNLDYFNHARKGISMSWSDGSPHVDPYHSRLLVKRLGPMRQPDDLVTEHHEDVAASLQRVTEEIIFHLLNRLHQRTGKDRVVLVGGCAMNSVANGKICRETPFKELYVPAGAADNGTAIGAAFDVWHRRLNRPRTFELKHACWGDVIDAKACRQAAESSEVDWAQLGQEELLDTVVDAICDGQVVGWFQDRMEFGARALGSRSLLADPRRTDMRDIINLKIKFREKFRPFAPSVLEEYVTEYFEVDEPSPFMERVLPIRADKHHEIPAVTHVDGSGRLQTVSKQESPLYWELIERFRQRTGVAMLLNTSLNENEPIVRTPAEAVSCFERTAMDMLVLGPFVLSRAVAPVDEASLT